MRRVDKIKIPLARAYTTEQREKWTLRRRAIITKAGEKIKLRGRRNRTSCTAICKYKNNNMYTNRNRVCNVRSLYRRAAAVFVFVRVPSLSLYVIHSYSKIKKFTNNWSSAAKPFNVFLFNRKRYKCVIAGRGFTIFLLRLGFQISSAHVLRPEIAFPNASLRCFHFPNIFFQQNTANRG